MFIAVLGLLGGFATPALLSTGENRPIPLFAYLLLLNIGLAWVANRKRWPVLTILTLVLTTLYQWGWVIRFLTASQLSLAMGIFLRLRGGGIRVADRSVRGSRRRATTGERRSGRSVWLAAAMPLFFAVYLAAVPAYGAQPALLFGFLLIVDAGLLAVTIARGEPLAHATGARRGDGRLRRLAGDVVRARRVADRHGLRRRVRRAVRAGADHRGALSTAARRAWRRARSTRRRCCCSSSR